MYLFMFVLATCNSNGEADRTPQQKQQQQQQQEKSQKGGMEQRQGPKMVHS